MRLFRSLVVCFSLAVLMNGQIRAQNITSIHDIQGDRAFSPLEGETVRIAGIVTADYQDNLQNGGFYLQSEEADGDPATSEGIFVYCDPDDIYDFADDAPHPQVCAIEVSVGDLVEVEGIVSEEFGLTQIDAREGSVTSISQDNPLPAPIELDITTNLIQAEGDPRRYYEPFEGMLVTITDTLTVSEYFQLSRYGEVVLYQGGRPYQYTHVDDTPTEAEFDEFEDDLDRRRIILDDDSNVENLPVIRSPQLIFYPAPQGLSTDNFFRGGDTVTNLTGILSFGFGEWRIFPVPSALPVFTAGNPRHLTPPEVDGSLKVASFNVLNYFTTLGERGANSPQELNRQAEKIVAALAAIDADVYGLMEIENNGTAVADLVERLNVAVGANTYDFIDTGVFGTDEIALAMIYKPGTVSPTGVTVVLDDEAFTNPNNLETEQNRPAIAQTFTEMATGESFTIVVNHLKSKGSSCGVGDDDPIQGNCNGTRTAAAQVLVHWLESDPTQTGETDILITGDLNAYAGEDPIDAIKISAYHDLLGGPATANYSYVFDGQLGYLDHVLASDSLLPQVAGIAVWHINADEIPQFDYNDEVRDPGEARFDEEPDGNPLYKADAFRASDHDPVIVGLQLGSAQ